jgi:lantibiotic modifying enzyme
VLYRPDWHEPLTERAWSEAWVRDAVARLVDDAVRACDPAALWPTDPNDTWVYDLYGGGAGVAWALARLGAEFDARAAAERALELVPDELPEEELPLPAPWRSSLLVGETGAALAAHACGADRRTRLLELVAANLRNETNELMWGVPGTLLVARLLGHADESERALRAARDPDGWWTQHLYGHVYRNLGPVHGLIGNVHALDEVAAALPMLRELARHEGAHVNWPPGPGDEKLRLQWCHGAPGILIHAGGVLDEDLLLGAALLTWDAGPLERSEKGAGICHGTAGNGYALLRTFERTQDELWLRRARAFAVHALEQAEALPPRYSLFTGGIGAVLFAVDCLDGVARFPVLDWI